MKILSLKNTIVILCSFLLFGHYFLSFYLFNLNVNDGLFLSLGYPSDPVVFPLIIDFFSFFSKNYHFTNLIFFFPEYLINFFFGFQYIWITALLYKFLYFFVIFYFFYNFKRPINKRLLMAFFLFVVFLISSNYEPNNDRLIRTSLSNIFQALLIFTLLKCYFKKKIVNTESVIIGLSSAACLSMIPWDFFFIISLFLINIKNLNKNNILLFFLGFLFFYFPNLFTNMSMFVITDLHLEYLAIKEIYNLKIFFLDFFLEILKSKKIIFIIILLGSLSFLNKSTFYLKLILIGLFLGFLPYAITFKTALSYHILKGLFSYLFFLFIFFLYQTLNNKKIIKKLYLEKISTYLCILLLIMIIIITLLNKNSWLERSSIIKKNYQYHFNIVKNLNKDQIIVTNDKYLRAYLYLNNFRYLPEDGFLNKKEIETTIKETLLIMKKIDNFEDRKFAECIFLKSSTENLFDSTRSTKSKLLNYDREDLIKINSTSGWRLKIPNELIKKVSESIKDTDIKNSRHINLYFYDKMFGQYHKIEQKNLPGLEVEKCIYEKNNF
jgi:hypothetical protein